MKIISWNVNGLRSILGKGLLDFWTAEKPDVLCLQETKAKPEQVADVNWPRGFEPHWNSAEKPGYSGTATFSKKKPKNSECGIGADEHDREGRVVTLEYEEFYLVNVYTPNSQRELTRLDYRTKKWEPAFRKYLKKLEKKKPVVFCGDLNVAHTEDDLANPKTNRKNAGFTDEERAEFQALIDAGFVVAADDESIRSAEMSIAPGVTVVIDGAAREVTDAWTACDGVTSIGFDRLTPPYAWTMIECLAAFTYPTDGLVVIGLASV